MVVAPRRRRGAARKGKFSPFVVNMKV